MLFNELKQNLKKDFSGLPRRRIALLGDSATQFLAKAITAYGYEKRISFQVFEAEFDQIDRQVVDADSELYHSDPEFVVLSLSAERLWERFTETALPARADFAREVVGQLQHWWQTIASRSSAKIIQMNLVEKHDFVFGHFSSKVGSSFYYQLKKINFELMNAAQAQKQVFVADIAALAADFGHRNAHDPRLYATAKVAFALDFLPAAAKAVTDIVCALSGAIKKCLILDLDNTVWGGVIGDDGMENIQIGHLGLGPAFDGLQKWARELKNRGIILAVCSKNDDAVAKRPFQDHPEMVLRLGDIAVFVANWENKADNIKRIQETLNIGFDSMVFVDDNPFERNLVREMLPAVTVPELPEDPALYVPYLVSLNLFETTAFSDEDLQRTQQYQQEAARTELQKKFESVDDYLKSLEMRSTVKAFDSFSVPRIAQLTQRSNQFNLRTVRYSDADIERIRNSDKYVTLSFDLKDRFGDHGLIGLIILEKLDSESLFIDTWIMSCRVLKRGMEEFIVNQMAAQARSRGFRYLIGEYLPTEKNKMVKDLYKNMGFSGANGKWELELESFKELPSFIVAS